MGCLAMSWLMVSGSVVQYHQNSVLLALDHSSTHHVRGRVFGGVESVVSGGGVVP